MPLGAPAGWGGGGVALPSHHVTRVEVVRGVVAAGCGVSGFAPRAWLHRRHTTRARLSGVSCPPSAWGTMWSGSALVGVRVRR